MKRKVITYNTIVGFHNYPDAPAFCTYLADRHRHVFEIRCSFEVSHNNREIEINIMQHYIENLLKSRFGYPCEFGARSCEDIAEMLLDEYHFMVECQVLEDGYGGASLTR